MPTISHQIIPSPTPFKNFPSDRFVTTSLSFNTLLAIFQSVERLLKKQFSSTTLTVSSGFSKAASKIPGPTMRYSRPISKRIGFLNFLKALWKFLAPLPYLSYALKFGPTFDGGVELLLEFGDFRVVVAACERIGSENIGDAFF